MKMLRKELIDKRIIAVEKFIKSDDFGTGDRDKTKSLIQPELLKFLNNKPKIRNEDEILPDDYGKFLTDLYAGLARSK